MSRSVDGGAAGTLAADRHRAQVLLRTLQADLAAVWSATEGANTDDEHDPEGSTIAFERSQLSVAVDSTRHRLLAIDAALLRLQTGTFGVCASCGRPIAAQRLEARPTSETCLDCATGSRAGRPPRPQLGRNPAR